MTPFGSQQAPTTPEALGGGLVIPSSSSIGPGEFNIQGDYGPDSFGGPSSIVDVEGIDQMLDEPDFVINDDGTVIDPPKANTIPRTPAAPRGATMHSDAGASAQVRQEHEEGVQAYAPVSFTCCFYPFCTFSLTLRPSCIYSLISPPLSPLLHHRLTFRQQTDNQMDLDLPILNDDLPEGEAFPTAPIEQPSEVAESSSPVVAANSRKRRAARALPIDATMELRNKDLADWSTNYLTNMKAENEHKHKKQLARIAKKNAEYWVWGAGIGGIASRLGGTSGPTPFDRFIGDNLFEFFTGVSPKRNAGAKRDRDSGIDEATQAESRRVRQKTGEPEEEMGRGQEDEAMFIPGGDEVELPREAPSALDDQQIFSAMPWNMSASLRGSSAVPRSAQVGIIGSAAPPSSLTGRRGSRMISASPLHGRGQSGGLEALQGFDEAEDEFGNIASDDFGFAGPGPSSDVPDDPHAEPIARVREALSAEGENFLIFVADGIDEKRSRVQAGLEPMSDVLQADAVANTDEVTFEELLPPTNNSKMVAASALVMTLTLGTKGLLNVRQDDDFEEIGLSLTEKGKAVLLEMPAEEVDAEEGAGEEQQEEGGHFEEQFAAAHGGDSENDGEDDDDDSLYAN